MNFPADFGPIYKETLAGRFPVEPWNTTSNLVFLLIFIYWAKRTRFDFKGHPFLCLALPLLLIGFIGGTAYHATRASSVWLVMDFVPIFLLAFAACIYFWTKLLGNLLFGIAAFAALTIATLSLHPEDYLENPTHMLKITLGYLKLAFIILLPACLHALKNRKQHALNLAAAVFCFGIAIYCRQIDQSAPLPMGTHFLWHIFGGGSTFFLIRYIYLNRPNKELGHPET